MAGRIGKFRPLPEPIKLQDLLNCAAYELRKNESKLLFHIVLFFFAPESISCQLVEMNICAFRLIIVPHDQEDFIFTWPFSFSKC